MRNVTLGGAVIRGTCTDNFRHLVQRRRHICPPPPPPRPGRRRPAIESVEHCSPQGPALHAARTHARSLARASHSAAAPRTSRPGRMCGLLRATSRPGAPLSPGATLLRASPGGPAVRLLGPPTGRPKPPPRMEGEGGLSAGDRIEERFAQSISLGWKRNEGTLNASARARARTQRQGRASRARARTGRILRYLRGLHLEIGPG